MTKSELIEAVHAKAGGELTRKATGEVVEAVFAAVASSIQADGKFFMPAFGTFQVKERAARTGRNPRTKMPIKIEATKTVGFKAATDLKNSL